MAPFSSLCLAVRLAGFTTALVAITGLLNTAIAQSREEIAKAMAAPSKAKVVHKVPKQPRVKLVYRDRVVAKPNERVVYRDRPPAPASAPTEAEPGWNDAAAMLNKGIDAYKAEQFAEARRYYTRAGELGEADAMVNLGQMYDNGLGGKQDNAQARAWYQKAADKGGADTMYKLGMFYQHGWGMKQDLAQSYAWYQKAADAGNADAKRQLNSNYRDKPVAAESHVKESLVYRTQSSVTPSTNASPIAAGASVLAVPPVASATLSGPPIAPDIWDDKDKIARMGDSYVSFANKVPDGAQGWRCYIRAVELGSTHGVYGVGRCYQKGFGVEKDFVQAKAWYERAIALGETRAIVYLGDMYAKGEGTTQDFCQAKQWYKQGAEAGDVMGMFNLGSCYYAGFCLGKRDKILARQLLQKVVDASSLATADAEEKSVGERAKKLLRDL